MKAGLARWACPPARCDRPLVDATDDEMAQLRADCAAAGLELPE